MTYSPFLFRKQARGKRLETVSHSQSRKRDEETLVTIQKLTNRKRSISTQRYESESRTDRTTAQSLSGEGKCYISHFSVKKFLFKVPNITNIIF